jgi:hypothetical protein
VVAPNARSCSTESREPETDTITTKGVPPLNTRSPVKSTERSATHDDVVRRVRGPMCCNETSRSSTHTER